MGSPEPPDFHLTAFPEGHYVVVYFAEGQDLSTLRLVEGIPALVFRLRPDWSNWSEFEAECGHMAFVANVWRVEAGVAECVLRLADQMTRVLH